jgi:hypothetical protein
MKNKYIKKAQSIKGWLTYEAELLLIWIDEIQKINGIKGNIFEIGVHHGRSAAVLGAFLRNDEFLGACDVFEYQQNISASGKGDKKVFLDNMNTIFKGRLDLQVFETISSQLDPGDIGSDYRLFHIDGGHLREEAYHDLHLASEVTKEEGLIILDDPFRAEWPGVTEALIQFLDEKDDYCPIFAGFNKIGLGKNDSKELYSRELENVEMHYKYGLYFPLRTKIVTFVGQPLRVFYLPVEFADATLHAKLLKYIRPLVRLKRNGFSLQST